MLNPRSHQKKQVKTRANPAVKEAVSKPLVPMLKEKTKVDTQLIDKAFEISAGDEEQVYISQMGLNLRKINPSFDTRAFGYKTLTQLFENLANYEVIRKEINGAVHFLVKRK